MDPALQAKLEALEKKVDDTYASVEKIRKYLMWTAIITIAVIVLPMIGLVFVIPQFISTYTSMSGLLQ